MTVVGRQFSECDACQYGKQKRKSHNKKLERDVSQPNQIVFADLMFPGRGSGSRYVAVLVVMNAFAMFVMTYLLKNKSQAEVNVLMQQYFVNAAIDAWYAQKGIEHVKIRPKGSQLNPCERAHQTLAGMVKSMMAHSGLPISLWTDALMTAVYIKNRVFCKGLTETPFERMFGTRPDVHHIRTFGALAYVHVAASPARAEFDDNSRLGYVIGYAENVVGCKVFFPDDDTKRADLSVDEQKQRRPGLREVNERKRPKRFMEEFAQEEMVAIQAKGVLEEILHTALSLVIYGGDVNTAYLDAMLGIEQFADSVDGFPRAVHGDVYVRCATERCMFMWHDDDTIVLVLIYVDKVMCTTNKPEGKCKLFEKLDGAYGLKGQGLISQYLGIEIEQDEDDIFIRQQKYCEEVLARFGFGGPDTHKIGNPMEVNARLDADVGRESETDDSTGFAYREAVGSLIYLATSTRPDFAYVVGQLSRYVARPNKKRVGAMKRVLRYLVGTSGEGIRYLRGDGARDAVKVSAFSDSDWEADLETRRSVAGNEAAAMVNILSEALSETKIDISLGVDNQSSFVMATDPTLCKISSVDNPSDMFTKALNREKLKEQHDQAIQHYMQALDKAPFNVAVLANLPQRYLRLEQLDDAHVKTLSRRVAALHLQKRWKDAAADTAKAIGFEPENPDLVEQYSVVVGDYENALAHSGLDAALALMSPTNDGQRASVEELRFVAELLKHASETLVKAPRRLPDGIARKNVMILLTKLCQTGLTVKEQVRALRGIEMMLTVSQSLQWNAAA
ncbi:hypothetical protein PybrP1_001686 [[Pythium] brassicae (nom. inval.)]|nr:hypothetical protein PybrP1_001686 [[Pythium] brassicae (nom. inval.)]